MRSATQSPTDPNFIRNPYPFYAGLRANGDFAFWEELQVPVAVTHAAVNSVLADPRFKRQPPNETASQQAASVSHLYGSPTQLSNSNGTANIRALIETAFSLERIQYLAPEISRKTDTLIEDFSDAPFDLVERFAAPLSICVIVRMLGVPCYMAPMLQSWSQELYAATEDKLEGIPQIENAKVDREFAAYMREFLQVKTGLPGQDLTSDLLRKQQSGELSEGEIIAACMALLFSAHEATVNAIATAARSLINYENSAAALTPEHISATVEECLRYDPPLQMLVRYTQEDTRLEEYLFAKGTKVGCLVGSACRDDAIWVNSERFDPFRRPRNTMVFGVENNQCLGASTIRLVLQIALPILFSRCPSLNITDPPTFQSNLPFRRLKTLIVET